MAGPRGVSEASAQRGSLAPLVPEARRAIRPPEIDPLSRSKERPNCLRLGRPRSQQKSIFLSHPLEAIVLPRGQRNHLSALDAAEESYTDPPSTGRFVDDTSCDGPEYSSGKARFLPYLTSQRGFESLAQFDHPTGEVPSTCVLLRSSRPPECQHSASREENCVDSNHDPDSEAHVGVGSGPPPKEVGGKPRAELVGLPGGLQAGRRIDPEGG
jgi:hypothetical protein